MEQLDQSQTELFMEVYGYAKRYATENGSNASGAEEYVEVSAANDQKLEQLYDSYRAVVEPGQPVASQDSYNNALSGAIMARALLELNSAKTHRPADSNDQELVDEHLQRFRNLYGYDTVRETPEMSIGRARGVIVLERGTSRMPPQASTVVNGDLAEQLKIALVTGHVGYLDSMMKAISTRASRRLAEENPMLPSA